MTDNDSNSVAIMTWKELLYEQFLLEEGRFHFRRLSQKRTNQIMARALSRKADEGWRLRAVKWKWLSFRGSNYIFEKDVTDRSRLGSEP